MDTFRSGATTVELSTTITTSTAQAFSTELSSGLHFSSGGGPSDGKMSGVWLPWAKGCVQVRCALSYHLPPVKLLDDP